MIVKLLPALLTAAALLSSCSVVDQNLKAREMLLKCRYELERLEFVRVEFKDRIVPERVWFNAWVVIENVTEDEVALDRAEADLWLEGNKLSSVENTNFLRIRPGAKGTAVIPVSLGFDAIADSLDRRPDNITVEAKLFLTLLIGKMTLETPVEFGVKKTFPIPYDSIDKAVRDHNLNPPALKAPISDVKKAVKKLF
jgi:hypothetical protein